jgi:hypothetical protein
MNRMFSQKYILRWFLSLAVFLLWGGGISIYAGQDANWDLKNYHLYNAWAYLNNRLSVDIFAAGIQSYFSPFLDIPYYLLSTQWFPTRPRLVAFIMGLPYGLLIFIVFLISWFIIDGFGFEPLKRLRFALLISFLGVTGVATVSQLGTTFNEVPLAAITLSGLFLLITAITKSEICAKTHYILLVLSGLLFGASAGLKLTACTYAPGAAIVAAAIKGNIKYKVYRFVLFSAAWTVAFMALWAPWGLKLYHLFGNPLFPLFNSIFHSPWMPPCSGLDTRYFPKNWIRAIFYPFDWINNPSMTVMEARFADPRFAVVFAFFLLTAIVFIPGRLKDLIKSKKVDFTFGPAEGILLFFIISYVIWESLFSILRYTVTLECILGPVLFVLLIKIKSVSKNKLADTILIALTVILMLEIVVFTRYPEWGHVRYRSKVFKVWIPEIPDDSLIIFIGKPIAYLAPFLAQRRKHIEFIGMAEHTLESVGYQLDRMVKAKISKWQGPIMFVARKNTMEFSNLLTRYSLSPGESCTSILSSIDEVAFLCSVNKDVDKSEFP